MVLIALTSGTTGMPKVAEHPIGFRVALGDAYHKKLDLKKEEVIFNVINAVAGLRAPICYSSVRQGAKLVTIEIWKAKEALRIIEKERPTVLLTTPAQLAKLVQEIDFEVRGTSSFWVVYYGTSPLTSGVASEAKAKLGVPILNAYGSFDGGGISSTSIHDRPEVRRQSESTPHQGKEVMPVNGAGTPVPHGEQGEVLFRGPCSCSGYYRDLERNLEMWGALGRGGWFHTGDLVRLDNDRNIVLTGRKKDVLTRGGQNIYPPEIECLLLHPKV